MTGLSGDISTLPDAEVWADAEGAHVALAIKPYSDPRADILLTPDQAEHLAAGLTEAARLARVVPEDL